MKKQYVALFCSESLLSESLEHLLGKQSDVEILGPWVIDESAVERLNAQIPDIVVIVGESMGDKDSIAQRVALLTVQILENFVGLPVIQVSLEQDQVHIYNSQTVPARSADFIKAIRKTWTEDNC